MKILLLTIGLALNFTLSAQKEGFWTLTPDDKIVFDSTNNEYYIAKDYKQIFVDEFTNTPGKEFNLYVEHHTKGIVLTLTGGVIMGAASVFSQNNSSLTTLGVVMGGLLSLTGVIYTLEAPVHIKRAAIILNATGVGIKYKL